MTPDAEQPSLLLRGTTIADCNDAALALFRGQEREDLASRSLQIITFAGSSTASELLRAASSGEPSTHTCRLVRLNGQHFTAFVTVEPVAGARGRAWLRIRDATARLADGAFSQELGQVYLNTLFEHAPEGIIIIDRHGIVLAANAKFQRLFGYQKHEILGESIDELIVPERLREEAEDLNQQAIIGMDAETQTFRRRKDGSAVQVSIIAAPIMHEGALVAQFAIYRDITHLKETEARLDAVLSQAPLSIVTLDAEGTFTFCAGRALKDAGLEPEAMLGKRIYDLFPELPDALAAVNAALQGEKSLVVVEYRGLSFETQYVPIRDGEEGPVTGAIGVSRDVTETMLARKQLEYMAHHDVLTGLPNRALYNDRLQEAMNRAKRHQKKFAVLFIDLDRFKVVNDTLGHQAGDRLIQWVGTRCLGCVRDVDTVSRLGGDEFAILLEDLDSAHGAAIVAQRVLDSLAGPYRDSGQLINTGGSIGISLFPDDGLDAETLLKHADAAMYRAKERGRGSFEFFSRDLGEASAAIFTKTSWLRESLEAGGFVLHYQPTIDLRARRINGVEALIRMRKPDGALMPPLEFIALAEETGLIIPIGEWVINEACKQLRAWDAQGHTHLRMAVNLSAKQFQDRKFVQKFSDVLAARGVKPSRVMVEVTESMMLPDPQAARTVFGELKDMHVAVAIDDFGTGYSSLAYLKDFPVDFVKIDRTFVAGVPHDEKACGITRTIAVMSRNLQLGVIAEGVETEAQYKFLTGIDCDEAQGFYFAHPMDAAALSAHLLAPGIGPAGDGNA